MNYQRQKWYYWCFNMSSVFCLCLSLLSSTYNNYISFTCHSAVVKDIISTKSGHCYSMWRMHNCLVIHYLLVLIVGWCCVACCKVSEFLANPNSAIWKGHTYFTCHILALNDVAWVEFKLSSYCCDHVYPIKKVYWVLWNNKFSQVYIIYIKSV
jgi:hypothetical protein